MQNRGTISTLQQENAKLQERVGGLERSITFLHENAASAYESSYRVSITELETELTAAKEENERLRALLIGTPVLIIDEMASNLLGEDHAVAYMKLLREWKPKVDAALATEGKDNAN